MAGRPATIDVVPRDPDSESTRAGFVVSTGSVERQLHQLATTTAELAGAETMGALTEIAVFHIGRAVRAAVATLMVVVEDQLVLVGAAGIQPGIDQRFAAFGVGDQNPASEAARTGVPVVLAAGDGIESRYPVLEGTVPAGRSLVCLPLRAGSQTLGVIGLTFEDSWIPGSGELEYLTNFADFCAQAMRRIRATEQTAELLQHLAFLAEASVELARSLDYRQTLSNVARLSVPTLADWCAVAIDTELGLTTLAVAHVDPDRVAWAWELQDRYPPDPDAETGAPNVLRTGTSELYTQITDEMLLAGARDEQHLQLSRELDLRSALLVPLTARGQTLGVITLLRSGSSSSYTPADLAIAEDLGRRAGVAVDNARLHSQTVDVALQLQRAVLPEDLSDIPGWVIATHYSPSDNAEVGGDFYDAIPLADGQIVISIGDVMGHGLQAAAAMAQMRASIRAFLSIDPAPSAVMTKLDGMFERLGLSQLVTLFYGVIDPHAGQLSYVNAGHYPPVIIDRPSTARFVGSTPQRPLGAGGDRRTATVTPLKSEDIILLYTDGLVEQRGQHIDAGLDRLRARASTLSHAQLQASLDTLVDDMRGTNSCDDITALCIAIAP